MGILRVLLIVILIHVVLNHMLNIKVHIICLTYF